MKVKTIKSHLRWKINQWLESIKDPSVKEAAAMNTAMYENVSTKANIRELTNRGHIIVPPQCKKLYCGTTGVGAMAQIGDIVKCLSTHDLRHLL